MARIQAYSASEQASKIDDTIVDFNIITSGPNRNLRKTQEDGTIQNLGNVKGATGPQGTVGGGLDAEDIEDQFASYHPGPWTPLPLNSNWEFQGSTYQDARYRVNNGIVEFDGIVNYIGTTAPTVTLLDVYNFPVELRPTNAPGTSRQHLLRTLRSGPYGVTLLVGRVVAGGTPVFQMAEVGSGAAPDWVAGTWLNLTNLSYPLDVPT